MIVAKHRQEVKSSMSSGGAVCELSWGHDSDSALVRSSLKKKALSFYRKKPTRVGRAPLRQGKNETKPK